MKMIYTVTAMLALCLSGCPAARAQQPTNSSSTPSTTPAQPPPSVVKKEPAPSPDKYPLAEAVRILESGDASRSTPAKHAPTVPALAGSAPPPLVSSEVPRSFEAKHDVALNATGSEAVLLSREWTESRSVPVPGKDGRVVYAYGGGLPIVLCAPLHFAFWNWNPEKRLLVSHILATASDGRSHRPRRGAARTQRLSSLLSRGLPAWTRRWLCRPTGGPITFGLNRNQMNTLPAWVSPTRKTANKSGRNILPSNAKLNRRKRPRRSVLRSCRTQHSRKCTGIMRLRVVTYRRALCTSWMMVRRPISKCLSRRFTANCPCWW